MYSPLHTVSFIRDMLRQMFFEYGGDNNIAWDEDPKKSKIMIGTVSDNHTDERAQMYPRILIQRGPQMVQSQFIGSNLHSRQEGGLSRNGQDTFRQDVSGSLNIIIECRNEGTCEEIGEMVRRFLCWCKPYIESTFGFQAFGKQFQMSGCDMDREDTEKFKININIPYIIEDRWKVTGDFVRLNHIFLKMTNDPQTSVTDATLNQ